MGSASIRVINAAAGLAIPYEDLPVDAALEHGYPDCADFHGCGPFAVIVADDSMEPSLCQGDYLVFTPVDAPGARAVLEDGAVVLARFGRDCQSGTCILARYYAVSETLVLLRRDNPGYQPITVSREMIQRLAVAVERRTKFF